VVRVEYDPTSVSYEALLDRFWSCHDSTIVTWQRQSGSVSHCGEPRLWQYRSAIFTHTAEQVAAAAASVAAQREAVPGCLTYAEPARAFYPAEDYHQK
jgi:peptide-methionine (S)-S-oxide reductase